MYDGWRIAALVLSTAGYVFAFLLIPRIVLERRRPTATIAWVLAIALLPVVGVPLYYLIGGRRIRRHIRAKTDAVGTIEFPLENRVKPDDLPGPVAAACGRVLCAAGAPPPIGGNEVAVTAGGADAYRLVLELIDGARDHIHAQFFILDVDVVGRRFIQALSARAREGVRVRLLLDAVGSWRALRQIVRPLRKAGGEVAEFLPALPLHRKWSAHLRNHRKLLIVDGSKAFAGGMNIGNRYMRPRAAPGMWRDSAVTVRGPAVRDLQAIFLDDWAFATDEASPPGQLFPPLPGGTRDGDGRAGLLQVVASGPDRPISGNYHGVFTAITSAAARVWIATPYFVPDDAISASLENAALKGIDVRLILPEKSDIRTVALAGRSYYEDMMRAGVRIYTYAKTTFHGKMLIVDDAVAVVGSSNVDIRSFFLNFEIGIFLYRQSEIAALSAAYERDLADSTPLDPDAFARRSGFQRLLEDTCRIFSPLF